MLTSMSFQYATLLKSLKSLELCDRTNVSSQLPRPSWICQNRFWRDVKIGSKASNCWPGTTKDVILLPTPQKLKPNHLNYIRLFIQGPCEDVDGTKILQG